MKVLIFLNRAQLGQVGGPRGYCYNIAFEAKKKNDTRVCFLDDSITSQNTHSNSNKVKIYTWIKKHFKALFNLRLYSRLIYSNNSDYPKSFFNNYDIVHFHSTIDLFRNLDELKDYRGKVVLTSHSPIPSHMEIMRDRLSDREKRLFKMIYSKLEMIDEKAFDRADYIVFPCEFAEEPYYSNWKKYSAVKERNKNKYKYLLTGIVTCVPKRTRQDVRSELGCNDNDFLVSYVGRHNETKGYDSLQLVGARLLSQHPNFKYVICGKEEPLKGLTDDRWIEIGWTKDAYSYISASDVFVLPNKETYFDIVMLEVLSLGKIVIASNTGGNKYFAGKSAGIMLYNSNNEMENLLLKVQKMSFDTRKKLGEMNQILFNNEFSSSTFFDNYIRILEEINNDL